jgi:hypothetical protein
VEVGKGEKIKAGQMWQERKVICAEGGGERDGPYRFRIGNGSS